ncbi:MAG TPA: PAS domain S-box protein, partial [Longimicrobiaceae bacterium]|nr:PAS domain S-box protein [Longimicrobiaceae bacterium]
YRWLHARAAPVFGADGRVHEWVGAESDITRRRRAEETVRFQAGLLEAVEQAVVATDLAGRVTYWNSWAESMLGWTAEEAIGRRMAELVPAAALADQADGVLARLQAGQGWAGEMALAARDGRRFAGLATASPIRNEVGGLVGIVHTLNDITPMKEAERALRESDERFRRLAATSPDLILVMDVSRAVPTYLNRAEFLGYTAADLNDTPTMLERVHPDDRARVDAARERLRAGGEEGQVTYRLRRRDGAWEWVENRHAVLDRTPDGRPAHTLSFLTVITARKEEEEALRAREDLLRGVLDRTGASVGVLSPDGTLLVANRRLLQDSGTRAEDVHGLPFEDTPPWSYSARVRGRLRAAIGRAAAGETVRYDETVRARNGFSTIDFMLAPLTGEDGTVTHLIASANDVTARVRAEDALRGDAERLRLAMLAVGGVVREHDLGTGAVSWDHGVADLLGYPEAAAGTDEKWWIERIHPQDVQGVVAGFRSWLRGSQPRWSAEYRFRRGDGTWLRVQDRVAAVRDSNGTASRAIGVIETVEAPSAASSVVRPEAPAAD